MSRKSLCPEVLLVPVDEEVVNLPCGTFLCRHSRDVRSDLQCTWRVGQSKITALEFLYRDITTFPQTLYFCNRPATHCRDYNLSDFPSYLHDESTDRTAMGGSSRSLGRRRNGVVEGTRTGVKELLFLPFLHFFSTLKWPIVVSITGRWHIFFSSLRIDTLTSSASYDKCRLSSVLL